MKDEKAIGIDIGGTNFRIGAVSRDGSVEHFEKISSQVLCAAAPNASTIVTAGMTGVVKVWQVRVMPKAHRYYHCGTPV